MTDHAEATALAALRWIAEDEARLAGLMTQAGVSPSTLRTRAAEPEFLGFVLDHVLGDEALAADFSAAAGLAEDGLRRARAALPGGDGPDWT